MEENNTAENMIATQKPNTMLIVVILAIVLVGGVGFWLFSRQSANTQAETTPVVTSQPETEVKEFAVEAGSFYYKPDVITVKKGDKVKIILNSVSMMHDFNIDELGVKIPVTPSGNSAEIEFIASEVGTFEYYCSVGTHRQMGQIGKLVVEE